jgi:hypothetical protein
VYDYIFHHRIQLHQVAFKSRPSSTINHPIPLVNLPYSMSTKIHHLRPTPQESPQEADPGLPLPPSTPLPPTLPPPPPPPLGLPFCHIFPPPPQLPQSTKPTATAAHRHRHRHRHCHRHHCHRCRCCVLGQSALSTLSGLARSKKKRRSNMDS